VACGPCQQIATRISDFGLPNPGPARYDTVAEPERAQRRDRVRRDDEAESRLAEFRRLLDHDRLDARLLERDRRRETAYPGSDNYRSHAFQPTSHDGERGDMEGSAPPGWLKFG
jgi:hypothetical protein